MRTQRIVHGGERYPKRDERRGIENLNMLTPMG
jgi:hypothetical protein